jgi:hypothetical protein
LVEKRYALLLVVLILGPNLMLSLADQIQPGCPADSEIG